MSHESKDGSKLDGGEYHEDTGLRHNPTADAELFAKGCMEESTRCKDIETG